MAASAAGPGGSFRRDLSEWRIVLVAWRLVVLQAAHPVVAAGMAEHSTYRGHPWRRIEHTMASGRRLFQADEEQLWREVQRLDRAHRRIRGTAEDGRGYDAHDPATRAWVLLTLFESVVAMRELSGEPYPAEELESSYREFAGIAAVFGLSSGELPATAAELRGRLRRTVLDELEFTDTARTLLYDVLREAPCPRRLRLLGPVGWRVLSAVVARLVAELTVADLPAVFRERFGLVPTRRGRLLSLLLHRGGRAVATRLPDRYRYRVPGADSSSRPRRPPRQDTRPPRLDRFFREVLDQTGDGHLTAHDFRAMAHNVCWQLELSEEGEGRVYDAFERWWEELRAGMDADDDGRVSRAEYIAATLAGCDRDPAYLERGLLPALRAVFAAADTDGDGLLDFAEYRVLFGGRRVHPAELSHGFRQLDTDGDGVITSAEFLRGFVDYFTARAPSAPGTQLLGRA
ncbi:calcium-binding protein [Streptomyces sp. XY431]|uniref:EF-hand domain-containing protein n=1 Tax=Streptomyces sp. XY431 TaxID=1415562 RepID=UPI0006AF5105|nr:EF-hand domain-containing protein [Streptomyces sp. XY431]KOV39083.1 calcium-binding protein [Streptomyces sp. XY431]